MKTTTTKPLPDRILSDLTLTERAEVFDTDEALCLGTVALAVPHDGSASHWVYALHRDLMVPETDRTADGLLPVIGTRDVREDALLALWAAKSAHETQRHIDAAIDRYIDALEEVDYQHRMAMDPHALVHREEFDEAYGEAMQALRTAETQARIYAGTEVVGATFDAYIRNTRKEG